MNTKKNICVMFGGRCVEHEIALISGLQLIEAMDRELYNPIPVYIAQSGKWYTGTELLKRDFYRGLPQCLESLQEVTVLPKPGINGLTKIGKKSFLSSLFGSQSDDVIPVEATIPSFHGTFGEDGCIQGVFEMAEIPYASSNVLASAVAMDKSVMKAVSAYYDIPILPSILISKKEFKKDLASTRSKILATPGLEKFPLFIKPNHLGSSIGISKVTNEQELDSGLSKVFQYDSTAIVEPCIIDIMEINISVLDAEEQIASVTEIPVGTDGVLSYEDKYMTCLLYTSPSPRDATLSRMPSSA